MCKFIISCSLAYVVVLNLSKGKALRQGYTTSLKSQTKSNYWDKNYRVPHTTSFI